MDLKNTSNTKENLLEKLKEWIQYIPLKWQNNLNYVIFSEYANISVREAEKFFNEMYEESYLFLKFQIKCPICKEECSIEETNDELFKCENCGHDFEWREYVESSNYTYLVNKILLLGHEKKEKTKSPIDLFKEKMKNSTDKVINLKEINKDREGIKVFISYAHEDEEYKDKLIKHLAILKRKNILKEWHDRKILAGQQFDNEISKQLLEADIILLMISVDFLNSDYCYEKEMQKALELNKANIARVIPIIVRKCDWKDSPFANLKVSPTDGKDLKGWKDEDEAYMNIINDIKAVINDIDLNC